jgi:hypothetical protein
VLASDVHELPLCQGSCRLVFDEDPGAGCKGRALGPTSIFQELDDKALTLARLRSLSLSEREREDEKKWRS